ncbi:MAG: rane dipeptidase [Desulfovibrionales bacterium]|nr:rane dipeptidase [Desulfovibrionales bacterium]
MVRYAVIDGHVDLLHYLRFSHPGRSFAEANGGRLSPSALEQGGVRVFASAYFLPDASLPPELGIALDDAVAYLDRYAPEILPIFDAAELRAAFEAEQGPPRAIRLLENSDALADYDLDAFTAKGFKIVGLTHFGPNRLAAGDRVDPAHGLTAAGRALLPRLARRGLFLDTAHLNQASFFEALAAFDGPVMCSHTGFRRFNDTPRNLSAEQLSALVDQGGVAGVTVAPEILSAERSAGVDDVVEAMDWAVQRHGPACVALGSDYGGFDTPNRGLEHPGLLPALAEALARRGYPDDAVAGIMGGNWLRFFEKNW